MTLTEHIEQLFNEWAVEGCEIRNLRKMVDHQVLEVKADWPLNRFTFWSIYYTEQRLSARFGFNVVLVRKHTR